MKKITRGGPKNGPVYEATIDEVNELNRNILMFGVSELPNRIRSYRSSNDEKYEINQYLLRICSPEVRALKYVDISKEEIEMILNRISKQTGE